MTTSPPSPPSSLPLLLIQSQRALSMSQTQLGQLLGVAKRTIQRWQDRETTLLPSTFQTLAAAVYPEDPALAARIAAHGSTTLEALGIVKPNPPEPPAPAAAPAPQTPAPLEATLSRAILVDSVVCVAADAVGVAPKAIRPALAAALVRARQVGLDVDALIEALTGSAGGAARVARRGRRR